MLTQTELHTELETHHKGWKPTTGCLTVSRCAPDPSCIDSTEKPAIPQKYTTLAVELKRALKRPAAFTLFRGGEYSYLMAQRARWFKAPKPLCDLTPKQVKAALGKEAKRIAAEPLKEPALMQRENEKLERWLA